MGLKQTLWDGVRIRDISMWSGFYTGRCVYTQMVMDT